jgi:hypothetical protein
VADIELLAVSQNLPSLGTELDNENIERGPSEHNNRKAQNE